VSGGLVRRAAAGALAAALALAPVASAAETLSDALISAYRSSDLLAQNRALLRSADEDVAVAVATVRPVIEYVMRGTYAASRVRSILGARTTENIQVTAALSASLTLYDGGANRATIDQTKEIVLATRQALVGVEQQVLLSAVDAYVRVRLAEDTVALRQSNVRVIDRELRAAQDRFELGEVTRTDVAIAEARLAAARSNLTAAEGDLAVARETYNLAVGRYPGRLAEPPRAPQTARTLDEAKAIARRTHHSIRQAQHQVQAAEFAVKRAAAGMGPRATFGAELELRDDGILDRQMALAITQPIYQGGRLSALYRDAMAQRDAARAALHRAAAVVDQSVGQSWAQVLVSRAGIEASDRQIRAARTAYDGVREEATLGARTTLDVLNAEQELLDAQAGRLQAVTNQYVATYSLLASMGLLTVEHLRLGIPTYDVNAYYNAVRNAPATSAQGRRLDRVMKTIGN
jgi:outer membrane protein